MTRKRFTGDTEIAQVYARHADSLLAQVKQDMRYAGLKQARKTITLPNGVTIQVLSVFGQDEIRVHAPAMPAVGRAVPTGSGRDNWYKLAIIYYTEAAQDNDFVFTIDKYASPNITDLGGDGGSAYAFLITGMDERGEVMCGLKFGRVFLYRKSAGLEYITEVIDPSSTPRMSRDGSTVVFDPPDIVSDNTVWFWREGTSVQMFESTSTVRYNPIVTGVSANGRFVCGSYTNRVIEGFPNGERRYGYIYDTRTGGIQQISVLDEANEYTIVTGISDDGSTLALYAYNRLDLYYEEARAYLWREGVFTELFKGFTGPISGDGRVVSGVRILGVNDSGWDVDNVAWVNGRGVVRLGEAVVGNWFFPTVRVECVSYDGAVLGGMAVDYTPCVWDLQGNQTRIALPSGTLGWVSACAVGSAPQKIGELPKV